MDGMLVFREVLLAREAGLEREEESPNKARHPEIYQSVLRSLCAAHPTGPWFTLRIRCMDNAGDCSGWKE